MLEHGGYFTRIVLVVVRVLLPLETEVVTRTLLPTRRVVTLIEALAIISPPSPIVEGGNIAALAPNRHYSVFRMLAQHNI